MLVDGTEHDGVIGEEGGVYVRRAHVAVEDVHVSVANTAGVDFDEDLALLDLKHGKVFDFQLLVAGDDGRVVGVWKGGSHS